MGGQIEEGDTNRTGKNEPGDDGTEEKRRETGTQRKEGGKGKRGKDRKPGRAGKTKTWKRKGREREDTKEGGGKKTRDTKEEQERKDEVETKSKKRGGNKVYIRTNAETVGRDEKEKIRPNIDCSGFFHRVLGKQKTKF